jgi:hypothetical protein
MQLLKYTRVRWEFLSVSRQRQADNHSSIIYLHAGSMLAIEHGRSMARVTAPAVLGESALLAALANMPGSRPLTYRCNVGHLSFAVVCCCVHCTYRLPTKTAKFSWVRWRL